MALNVRDVYDEQKQRKLCTKVTSYQVVFFHDATTPSGPRPPHFLDFMITLRHSTVGRTPLDE